MKNFLIKLFEKLNALVPILLNTMAILSLAIGIFESDPTKANQYWVTGVLFAIWAVVLDIVRKLDNYLEALSLQFQAIQLIGKKVFNETDPEESKDDVKEDK